MRIDHSALPAATGVPLGAIALAVALALATPGRAAAQEGAATPDSAVVTTDSARDYDEVSSVWNAHRVVRVLGDGGHVVLGDGTIWEVFLPDRPSVNTWRRGDLLVVRVRPIAQGDYDYSLIDGRTRVEVAARLVGAAPRRG
jgi:hypothetical protein